MDLVLLKKFMRIDGDTEDDLVQKIMDSAKEYISNATGFDFTTTSNLADMALATLCTKWYENPEMIGKEGSEIAFGLSSMFTQLRYCYQQGGVTTSGSTGTV